MRKWTLLSIVNTCQWSMKSYNRFWLQFFYEFDERMRLRFRPWAGARTQFDIPRVVEGRTVLNRV